MRSYLLFPAAIVLLFSGAHVPHRDALPAAVANPNSKTAGVLRGGAYTLALVATRGEWFPAGPREPGLAADIFAEEGKAPSVPGPFARVPLGTRLSITVRNDLPDTLTFCWRGGRRCASGDSVVIPPGERGELRTTAAHSGTFIYWGATSNQPVRRPRGRGGLLLGAIVVDSGARRPDRVLVLNSWLHIATPGSGETDRLVMAINGSMWPATERFRHLVGDSIRWRVVNGSGQEHPMHLHGFYFDVTARGDGAADTSYIPDARRRVVTESMTPHTTMSMVWTPERAGNWLFHCHKAFHVSSRQWQHLRNQPEAAKPHGAHKNHALEAMAGLIIGIEVREAPGSRAATLVPASGRPLRLVMQERAGGYGADPVLGFALQRGLLEPPSDSLGVPAPPLLLTRGEPVSITVMNRLREHTGVHWHGIELESYFDGVGGWSGAGQRVAPMIAPGDSFVAHFTPPRSGTFIYHAHADEIRQLSSGLYGAIIVLDPGQRWNDSTDHLVVIGQGGPSDTASTVVNGRVGMLPLVIAANRAHRFRVININAHEDAEVELLRDGARMTWREVAKDGADTPPAQSAERRALRRMGPGETFDFEITPRPGSLLLAVRSYSNVLLSIEAVAAGGVPVIANRAVQNLRAARLRP